MNLIVAGGGTGGHVLAGVAVADAWKKRYGEQARILFVGAEGGIEEKLVPRAGYMLQLLSLGSLNRVSWKMKLRTLVRLPLSLLRSAMIVSRFNPDAVLGVGGYASGPLVLMARILRWFGLTHARTAILEQNAVPGMTNRILGGWVDHVLCAFPTRGFEGRACEITGNPVRETMRPLPSARREPFTIFVFGGSQGAQGINSLVLDAIPLLGELKSRVRFIHQTGEKDHARVQKGHHALGTGAKVEKFIFDMPSAYAEASLLICRAGSSTLAEVAAVGRAAVLVPFPFAADNHQEKNARIFVDEGAAHLLVQGCATGEDLARIIRDSIANSAALAAMEAKVRAFYRPDSAQDIVRWLSGPV